MKHACEGDSLLYYKYILRLNNPSEGNITLLINIPTLWSGKIGGKFFKSKTKSMKDKIIDTFLMALTVAMFLFVIFSMVCAVYDAIMFSHMHHELHEVRDMLQSLNDSIYW